jgi:hypothetical protein
MTRVVWSVCSQVTLNDILALRGESAQVMDLSKSPDLADYNLRYGEDGMVELVAKADEQAGEGGK